MTKETHTGHSSLHPNDTIYVFWNIYFVLCLTSKPTAIIMSGRCLHFMGLTQNEDVMTTQKCFEYNHPTKPLRLMNV